MFSAYVVVPLFVLLVPLMVWRPFLGAPAGPATRGLVALALIAFAERIARDRGLGAIRLYTNEAMTENIALYRRLGFVETGRREEAGFRRVYMAKALDPPA